jgi:hypothetical protein
LNRRRECCIIHLSCNEPFGGQKIKLTANEIHEIEDLVEIFEKEPESVTSAERIIREMEINGKSCKLKVIIEVQEDYFEDSFTD